MIKGDPKEVYFPGQLYTMDDMLNELEKWRMSAIIYKDLTGDYHCDIFRPYGLVWDYESRDYRKVQGMTTYWGWCIGPNRFAAVQASVKRLIKIVNEYREDGYEDADI